MMNTRLEDAPLLESFVKGDDAFRNSRFKLIPYISKVGTSNIYPANYTLRAELHEITTFKRSWWLFVLNSC